MVALARLQDVERQLSTAATAVQLHLRGLESEREHIGWAQIAALALVCGRIEQVQSELRQSTTEILALARRSLAGGGVTDKGEDTETEDEDVELESEQSVKGETRAQVEEAEAASDEEEKQNEVVVKLESVAVSADDARDGVGEVETKESDDGSPGKVVDGVESSGETMICVSDVEVKREMISRSGSVEAGEQSSSTEQEQLSDHAAETEEVELAVEEMSRKKEENAQEIGREISEAGCTQGGFVQVRSGLPMDYEDTAASDTRIAPNEAKCQEDHFEMRAGDVEDMEVPPIAEPKTAGPDSVPETEALAAVMEVKSACTSPEEAAEASNNSCAATMDNADSKNDEERDFMAKRIAYMNEWASALSNLENMPVRDSLQSGNSATVALTSVISTTDRFLSEAMKREPKFNCRLWIERMIVALNTLFEMTYKPNVLDAFTALRENLPKLKSYCQEHYPDYISDMLNDVKSIEYLEQDGKLTSSILATSTRFLLDQLRYDCLDYSAKLSTDISAPRDDERWKQLMLMCKHLVTWIKHVPLPHEQFPAGYLTQTIQVLGAFDSRVPKRIPVELLENMIFMVQHTKSNDSPRIAIENDPNTSSDRAVGRMNPIVRVSENRDPEQKLTKNAEIHGGFEETQHVSETGMESTHDRESITDKAESRNAKNRAVLEEVVSENEVENILEAANQKAADAINDFRRCLKNGNCTADGAVSLTIVVRDMTSAVTSHDSKYSRRMRIEEVVEACQWILRGVHGTVLAQTVSPLSEYCKQLQLYTSRFPDCLQAILNDIKYIDARQLNSTQRASWLPRLLQRLRKDCCAYYQKIKGSTSELRSDEHWGLLVLICERTSEWIKQLSPADSKKYEDDLQRTVKTLTSFNKHFPNRISTTLLEIMRHAVGSDMLKSVSSSTSKKRLRDNSGCAGPEQKKGAHHSSHDKFNPIAKRYLQVAGDANTAILVNEKSITEPSAAKAFSDLKEITTMANTELLKVFSSDDILSANTRGCFELATQFMAHTISIVPGNVVDYDWLRRTTWALRHLLHLGASSTLSNERASLSESISVLATCMRENYEVESDVVPSLDAIEERVQRFKTQKWDFKTVKRPIQSISSGLLVDVKKINALRADTYLVRSKQNWSRFTAVGYALLVWTIRARNLAVPQSGLLNHLLPELLEFDAKYPSKLPPTLISNCQAISW